MSVWGDGGRTTWMLASEGDHIEMDRELLEAGADKNARGCSAHTACIQKLEP